MGKSKTKNQGYFHLKAAKKWLHFSMNAWVNLKVDSGRDIGTWGSDYDNEDTIGQFILLSDVAYAALKANDQEEGNEIDYDIYKVRTWMETLSGTDAEDFIGAMTHSMTLPEGKKGAKK